MEYLEISNKRELFRKSIERGTDFLFNAMEDGRAPAKKHDVEKPGIWTSTEILEFLLTNKVLPSYSLSYQIDAIIDFLISKYDGSVKGWGLTAEDPTGSFSAITTGHCIYVLKLYLNAFLDTDRKRTISKVISEAETSIIAKQDSKKGFWSPGNESSESVSTEMNYGKLFYSYHAYYGIKRIGEGTIVNSNSDKINAARKKANIYFSDFAYNIVKLVNSSQSLNFNARATVLGHVANLIQVLADIDAKGNEALLNELYKILDSYDDEVCFTATTVPIYELPANSYNNFHLNTPFAVFLALLSSKNSAKGLLKIADWYLDRQDPRLHCWYFNDDCNSGIDTWSTCEALLVLSYAHIFCYESYYEFELKKVKEKYEQCEACKDTIKKTLKSEAQSANHSINGAKQSMIISIVISIFLSLCSIAALIILSVITEEPWINAIITAVVIPIILQIVFFLRIPEVPKLSEEAQNVISSIDEGKM